MARPLLRQPRSSQKRDRKPGSRRFPRQWFSKARRQWRRNNTQGDGQHCRLRRESALRGAGRYCASEVPRKWKDPAGKQTRTKVGRPEVVSYVLEIIGDLFCRAQGQRGESEG